MWGDLNRASPSGTVPKAAKASESEDQLLGVATVVGLPRALSRLGLVGSTMPALPCRRLKPHLTVGTRVFQEFK